MKKENPHTPENNIQGRICLINVPDDISPLKFRSYFKAEAADIQAKFTGEGFAVIRLFLPLRIKSAYTDRQLDKLIQGVVDKHSHVELVEFIEVTKSLGMEEMKEESRFAEMDLEDIAEAMKNDILHD